MSKVATIGARGQVVMPVEMRRQIGLEPGQRVDVEVRDGTVVLTPIPKDPIAFLGGSLRGESPSMLDDLKREHAEEVRRDAESGV
jgi:AbrB family looped-hinge helix DNA binding protein